MVDQGRYEELAHEIRVLKRSPMIEIPAYRTFVYLLPHRRIETK